ncbi:MAG: chemotaxis protein CheD [Desulfitobacteriia bacterium]|jgi:chemotaxis protein CheD
MSEIITVGMADYKLAKTPNILMTAGLGSCIGICIYDLTSQIGSLGHIMLPSSNGQAKGKPEKYADTCIALMLEDLEKMGGKRSRFKAKMAGGAQMFSFEGKAPLLKIGERNAEAVAKEIEKARIPLLASDVGGNFGRTIHFDVRTGDLHIRTINQGEKVI